VATMDDLDKLPPDLTWQHDGHVTDIVLSSVADGESGIVAEDALSHLDDCEHCSARLGAEALLSAHAGELIAELAAPSPLPVKAKSPVKSKPVVGPALPKRAIIAALALAAFGAMPGAVDASHHLMDRFATLGRIVTMLARSAELVAKSEMFTTLAWAASAVLLMSGLVVSRISRPGSSKELAQEGGV